MNVGVLGMDFMQNEFSGIGMRKIWSEDNRIAKILEVERAIAKAEAEHGLIPQHQATIIERDVRLEKIDWRQLRLAYGRSGHFVSALVKYFENTLEDEAGSYLHFGATTQDILDTGMVLQLKEAHKDTKKRTVDLMRAIAKQTKDNKDVVAAGRAHGNHGIPINLGHQIGLYLDEIMDLYQKLLDQEDQVFYSAISGSVGTYAGYGPKGIEVAARAAQILELNFSKLGWHTRRAKLVDYMNTLALLAGVMGKMAKNLMDLSRSELKEFEEPYGNGRQGSTAMPTMRNPYLSEAVYNLANLIHNQMPLMYQSMLVSHEKDTVSWRNQWVAIPEINMYLSGMYAYLTQLMKGGTFNRRNIEHNLYLEGGMLVSERIMNSLAPAIGKKKAHQLVYELGNKARDEDEHFETMVRQHELVQEKLSIEELDFLFDPTTYTGFSEELLGDILDRYEELRANGF